MITDFNKYLIPLFSRRVTTISTIKVFKHLTKKKSHFLTRVSCSGGAGESSQKLKSFSQNHMMKLSQVICFSSLCTLKTIQKIIKVRFPSCYIVFMEEWYMSLRKLNMQKLPLRKPVVNYIYLSDYFFYPVSKNFSLM